MKSLCDNPECCALRARAAQLEAILQTTMVGRRARRGRGDPREDAALRALIKDLYVEHVSIYEISLRLSLKESEVRDILVLEKVPIRRAGGALPRAARSASA